MAGNKCDVLIVVPPLATASYPQLGAGVIVAACKASGIQTAALYANLALAAHIGWESYERVAGAWLPHMAGEAVFAPFAFPGNPDPLESLFVKGKPKRAISGPLQPRLSRKDFMICRQAVQWFLEETVSRILEFQPRIVGLSSTFRQTLASVAIARHLKSVCPEIITVLGGYNARMPMGRALAEIADPIDCVFSGEADIDFPAFCADYLDNIDMSIPRVVDCGVVVNLESVKPPDFEDYFRELHEYQAIGKLPASWPTRLNFESSRGCWWGKCRFCGLNGDTNIFRSKSASAVAKELQYLAQRYGINRFDATDTVMPPELLKSLSAFKDRGFPDIELLYEVRTNLVSEDIGRLARAGVKTIQPGIESLSTAALEAMKKGTTGVANVRLLRDALANGICVIWNYLIGVPGENSKDYEKTCELLPLLGHLQPPQTWGPIRIERFSTYFNRPSDYGIRNIRPFANLAMLFPTNASVYDLSLWFDADWETELLEDPVLLQKVKQMLQKWFNAWGDVDSRPVLIAISMPGGRMLVRDTRGCACEEYHILKPSTAGTLADLAQPHLVSLSQTDDVKELVKRKLVIEMDDCFLSLPIILPLKER